MVRLIARVNRAVLVLNQNYEPLNVCNVRRALVLVIDGKAEMLETHDHLITTSSRTYDSPSVIRLVALIRRPRQRVKLTRREIFRRDGWTCQYCHRQTHDLTLDHVTPRSRGGQHEWDNLVSACRSCNHRKGGKTIYEARMLLSVMPYEPAAGRYYTIERRLTSDIYVAWLKFLPGFELVTTPGHLSRAAAD